MIANYWKSVWLWSLPPWIVFLATGIVVHYHDVFLGFFTFFIASIFLIFVSYVISAALDSRDRDIFEENAWVNEFTLPFLVAAFVLGPILYVGGRLIMGREWVQKKISPLFFGLSIGYWISVPALVVANIFL